MAEKVVANVTANIKTIDADPVYQPMEDYEMPIVHVSPIQRRLPQPKSTTASAAAIVALSTYSKALSKEVAPKGVRVLSVALVERVATQAGADFDGGKRIIMQSLVVNRAADQPNHRKLPHCSLSWCHRARVRFLARST